MRNKIMMIIALVLIFTMLFGTGAVYGAQVGRQDYNQVQQQIEQEKKKLEEGKAEEQSLAQEIQGLETKISAVENQVAALQSQISTTEGKIAAAKEELKQAQESIDSQDANLNLRLRTMYKNGSIGFLDVLLGSGSISEFISNIDMVQKVHASDKKVLATLKDDYKVVKEKKEELDALQSQLSSQKQQEAEKQAQLTANKSEVTKKKANVAASNEARQDNIQDLNAEADHIMAIIQEEERKAREREEQERKEREERERQQKQQQQAQNGNNGSSGNSGNSTGGDSGNSSGGSSDKGNSSSGGSSGGSSGSGFTWPVPGHTRISSNYGWRICPFHGREKHTGIDIPAPYGTAVKAADSGTVIYAGYLGSYGNAVIIRHSSTLYTLYAHNSSLVVGSGKKVSRGQTVAKIGSTGSSTGNHLHFEVRKGGNSYGNDVNPWNYL